MFKKQGFKFTIILAFILVLSLGTTVFAEPIKVVINSQPLVVPINPIIQEGRTLVPLRAIFEALNVTVEWDQSTKTVTGTRDGRIIKLQIDNKLASINGISVELDVPGRIVEGNTLVPVRFIAESLGANVKWDDITRTVLINSEIVQNTNIVEVPVVKPLPVITTPIIVNPDPIADIAPVVNPVPIIINKSKNPIGPIGNPATAKFKGSLKSDKYHFLEYKHNGQIVDTNLIYFESKDHAAANGHKPCGICFK